MDNSNQTSVMANKRSFFLELPTEVRDQIYQYCLAPHGYVHLYTGLMATRTANTQAVAPAQPRNSTGVTP